MNEEEHSLSQSFLCFSSPQSEFVISEIPVLRALSLSTELATVFLRRRLNVLKKKSTHSFVILEIHVQGISLTTVINLGSRATFSFSGQHLVPNAATLTVHEHFSHMNNFIIMWNSQGMPAFMHRFSVRVRTCSLWNVCSCFFSFSFLFLTFLKFWGASVSFFVNFQLDFIISWEEQRWNVIKMFIVSSFTATFPKYKQLNK